MSKDDLTVICTQDFSSLASSIIQVPLHNFYVLPEGDTLVASSIYQQASSISHIPDVRVFLPLAHTPPK